MSEAFDQVRPYLDLWAVRLGGFALFAVALGAGLRQVWSWGRSFHAGYQAVTNYLEIESEIHAVGPILKTIAAQFEKNGGSSLRDLIEANHREAERHWTEEHESNVRNAAIAQQYGEAITRLTEHLTNLDAMWGERTKAMESVQSDVTETKTKVGVLEEKLDRWIKLVTDQEVA